jgi:hypothetical protein
MKNISGGIAILRDAERQLQELMAAAAKEGDYSGVNALMDWAFQLKLLVDRRGKEGRSEVRKNSSKQHLRTSRESKRNRQRKRSADRAYPKFVRDGDFLVKVGWSKSSREEYEHKAEKSDVFAVISAIAVAGSRGRSFQMEPLLPCKNSKSEKIPDYQAYLSLAWLRSLGLVEQQGRASYTIPMADSLQEDAGNQWRQIDSRN